MKRSCCLPESFQTLPLGLPNWTDAREKQLACLIREDQGSALYLMFNAGPDTVVFALPPVPSGSRWHQAIDSSEEAPRDLFAAGDEPPLEDVQTYLLRPRSSVVLLAR